MHDHGEPRGSRADAAAHRHHDISNVPFVFAGATDILNGGRYLSGSVIALNRVLVTACHAMGLTEVNDYGSLDTGSGPVPGVLV